MSCVYKQNKNKEVIYIDKQAFTIDTEGYKYSNGSSEINKFANRNKYVLENISLWLELNNYSNKLLPSVYGNSNDKLNFTCDTCGEGFKTTFNHLRYMGQTHCKKCGKIISLEKDKFSIDYIKKYYIEHDLLVLENEYTGVKQRINVQDNQGYLSKVSYNSLKASGGYEIFSKNNPYTIYNINKYIELNGIKCKLASEKYLGSKKKLDFECECGDTFTTTLNNFLHQNKIKCDRCAKKQSRYSLIIENYLKHYNIKYEKEYRFNNCRDKYPLPFDFAIFDKNKNILDIIEVDGEQHFYPVNFNGETEESVKRFEITKCHDYIKDEYCKLNNINLLRIPYWEFTNNNYIKILNKEMYTQV